MNHLTAQKRKIICVHPSAELYGADRCLVDVLSGLKQAEFYSDIDVIVPADGPLNNLLRSIGASYQVKNTWVLRRANFLRDNIVGVFSRMGQIFYAWRNLSKYECLYISTVVCLDYLIAARFAPKKCKVVVHVHEIPRNKELFFFRFLLKWSKAKLIFNSNATQKAFNLPGAVIYNGIDVNEKNLIPAEKIGDMNINILLIGRINAWKGQDLLVDACKELVDSGVTNFSVCLLGGVYGDQEHFKINLLDKINKLGLQDKIVIKNFLSDPSIEYQKSDVVVVPSKLPEPFGRVAVEALGHGKPVIASAHGGLVEIVDESCGILVEPNSSEELASALKKLIEQHDFRLSLANNARAKYMSKFTTDAVNKQVLSFFGSI